VVAVVSGSVKKAPGYNLRGFKFDFDNQN
jgi:hypothetical protein